MLTCAALIWCSEELSLAQLCHGAIVCALVRCLDWALAQATLNAQSLAWKVNPHTLHFYAHDTASLRMHL